MSIEETTHEPRTIAERITKLVDDLNIDHDPSEMAQVIGAITSEMRAELLPLVLLIERLISLTSPLTIAHDPIVKEHATHLIDATAFVRARLQ